MKHPIKNTPITDTQLKVFLTVRMLVLAVTLLAGGLCWVIIQRTLALGTSLYVGAFITIGILIILSVALILKRNLAKRFYYLSAWCDVALITAIIYFTGVSVSPFVILYIPVLVGETFLSGRKRGLIILLWCIVAYVFLLSAINFGFIPIREDTSLLSGYEVVIQLVVLAISMIFVVIATDYLRRNFYINSIHPHETLLQMSVAQEILIDGILESVLVIDSEENVVKLNQSAKELFQIDNYPTDGIKFSELVSQRFPNCIESFQKKDREEISLIDKNNESLRLSIFSQDIINSTTGEKSGTLFVLQDVTKLRSAEELLVLQEKMAGLVSEHNENSSVLVHPKLKHFVGESKVMQQVFGIIKRVASSDVNVLIFGESGTGKELAAKSIHLCGSRANKPFVALNCGAVPESLIESELFGYKKGAFTGAESDHKGMFQQANGGTLFLDEIGELPFAVQAKLLRAIQEKKIRMVGSEQEQSVDVRIISATNRDLEKEVEEGRFRQDLFYRLHVVAIEMPPLRERKEDLPLLINSILRNLQGEGKIPRVSTSAMKCLLQYNYPGNVRELENILELALVMAEDEILASNLPECVRNYVPQNEKNEDKKESEEKINNTPVGNSNSKEDDIMFPVDIDKILNSIELRYLNAALEKSAGSKQKAAELLGINLRSIRYRLKKYEE